MRVLVRFQHSDNDITEKGVESAQCGATLKQAASAAGLLPRELKQLFKWGEEGHPAWGELFRQWLEATGETMNEITQAITARAQDGDVEAAKTIMEKLNPEEWGQDSPSGGGGGNTMNINLRTDFSGLYPDAIDAEVLDEREEENG
jgi:uncharacterized protein YcaQ